MTPMQVTAPHFTPALDSFDAFVTRAGVLEPEELERIAREIAAQPDVWEPLVRSDLDRRRYELLYEDDRMDAWVLSWNEGQATMAIPGGLGMTATLDILEALAGGTGPEKALLALGYAGWGPGQLESEIRRNDWLIADPGPDVVFGDEDAQKWSRALKAMGVDPVTLSASSGRA